MEKKLDGIIDDISAIRTTLERMNECIYELCQASGKQEHDMVYPKAKALAIKTGYASPALFQRILHVPYARSAKLIDMLEEKGVIGPADGAKPRDILITKK